MTGSMERFSLSYVNLSRKWSHTADSYNKQYCSIYLIRLKQMEALLEERIRCKWGNKYPVCKLHKLSEAQYPKCVIIGTLFKDQKLKPSILKRLAESNQLLPQPIVTHFTDKSDRLFIEDELQRYQVLGFQHCDNVVTGISCALLGTGDDKGRFFVEDYTFANYREQVPRPTFDNSAYIVFLSGLDLVNSANFAMNLELLVCWLCGLVGDLNDVETSKVVRVIIAGNSIRNIPEEFKPSTSMLSRQAETSETIEAVKQLDKFLLHLSQLVEVDVMPGDNDPSNRILPQQPMHYCMFSESSVYQSLNHVSNPYSCSVGGLKILGSSGQPVRDIMRFSEITDPLEVLKCCLTWNHLAPTAPDTLGCFPFYDSDPFILEECPHVFFAGNQKTFAMGECAGPNGQEVKLICIPEFSSSFEVCLLDVKTLDCNTISFIAS